MNRFLLSLLTASVISISPALGMESEEQPTSELAKMSAILKVEIPTDKLTDVKNPNLSSDLSTLHETISLITSNEPLYSKAFPQPLAEFIQKQGNPRFRHTTEDTLGHYTNFLHSKLKFTAEFMLSLRGMGVPDEKAEVAEKIGKDFNTFLKKLGLVSREQLMSELAKMSAILEVDIPAEKLRGVEDSNLPSDLSSDVSILHETISLIHRNEPLFNAAFPLQPFAEYIQKQGNPRFRHTPNDTLSQYTNFLHSKLKSTAQTLLSLRAMDVPDTKADVAEKIGNEIKTFLEKLGKIVE